MSSNGNRVKAMAGILFLALCLTLVIWVSLKRFEQSVGIDFYHYWGVKSAMAEGDLRGKNPWAFTELYLRSLKGMAAETEDRRLRAAAGFRPDLDLTGTPLQYTIFSILPAGYSWAFALYQIVQMLCFAGAVWLIFQARWSRWAWAVALTAAMALFYGPLEWDILVGNLNAIQAFAVTALAYALQRRKIPAALFLSALVALVLFKPSVLLICLALACSLWWRERPPLWRTLLPPAVTAAALIALPCLYFGSWTVWIDWMRFLRDPERAGLFFPTEWGNYSTLVLIMEDLHLGMLGALAVAVALLAAGALVGIGLRGGGNPLREIVEDPFRICALGIVITAAISPVYWPHYYLFCFFAALYLLLPPRKPLPVALLALLSIVLNSGWITPAFLAMGMPRLIQYSAAASWLLLVPVLFLVDAVPPRAERP